MREIGILIDFGEMNVENIQEKTKEPSNFQDRKRAFIGQTAVKFLLASKRKFGSSKNDRLQTLYK